MARRFWTWLRTNQGPLYSLEAALGQIYALREGDTVSRSQRQETRS